MTYIDCFIAPVSHANKEAYEELAQISAKVVKENGALRVVECWLDEFGPDASSYHSTEARLDSNEYSSFTSAAGAGTGETVVMSYIEWPDQSDQRCSHGESNKRPTHAVPRAASSI